MSQIVIKPLNFPLKTVHTKLFEYCSGQVFEASRLARGDRPPTHHGVRFAAAGDAIGEQEAVLAVEQVAHEWLGDGVKQLLLCGRVREHGAELVLLLLGRAVAERLSATALLSVWIPANAQETAASPDALDGIPIDT